MKAKACLDGFEKSCHPPTSFRTLDHLVRSESLYRLHSPWKIVYFSKYKVYSKLLIDMRLSFHSKVFCDSF